MKSVGKVFHDVRLEKKLTQVRVADALGMSSVGVRQIENGRSLHHTQRVIQKFCDVVGMPVSSFYLRMFTPDDFSHLSKDDAEFYVGLLHLAIKRLTARGDNARVSGVQ